MKNEIIFLSGEKFKTLGISEERIFLSEKKEQQFSTLQKTAQDVNDTSKGKAILLEKINKLQLNTGGAKVKINYQDYTKKNKTVEVALNSVEQSKAFAQYLGGILGMNQTVSTEQQWLPLLKNIGWLILTLGLTYFMGTMDDASDLETSGGRRTRGGAAILRIIYDMVGQTGVFIIGTLIAVGIGYNAYKRFSNPENNIVYTK